jgi:hypothetical protein
LTEPLPTPLAPDVIESHVALLLELQLQSAADAVTLTLPVSAPAP